MSSESHGEKPSTASVNQQPPRNRELPKSATIPVFNCLVYVSRDSSGGVRAQVVNLAGIESTEATERQALAKVVADFKHRIRELVDSQKAIPWIEPVRPLEPSEQQRFIAVHL